MDVNAWYEEYLVSFYEELKRQGVERSRNALYDLMLGIPGPMTREEFMEWLVNTMRPDAETGFKYLKRTRRGGRKSGEARQRDTKLAHDRVEAVARKLLNTGTPRRGLARAIKLHSAGRCDLSERQINTILKAQGV